MKLFGIQLGGVRPQDKNLNQLIFDVAEYHRAGDREEIYKRLGSLEMFAPITSANFELTPGQWILIEKGMEAGIPTSEIQGLIFVAFLINKDDKRLGDNYCSMTVAEAFHMIEKMNDSIAGLAFYNDHKSYFGIAREDFPMVKSNYLS